MPAQNGLSFALIKANNYGYGWFSDHSEPGWFHAIRTRPAPAPDVKTIIPANASQPPAWHEFLTRDRDEPGL